MLTADVLGSLAPVVAASLMGCAGAGDRAVEPTIGSGNFFGLQPADGTDVKLLTTCASCRPQS